MDFFIVARLLSLHLLSNNQVLGIYFGPVFNSKAPVVDFH